MIKEKICLLIFLGSLLLSNSLSAQSKAYISGKIANLGLVKTIDIQVNQKYLNNDHTVYTAEIFDDGTFVFEIDIYEPLLVTINYSRNKALLFVEPNDRLHIDCDANNFQYSFKFSERAADNNRLLFSYFKSYPREMSMFKMTQYRHGTFWYSNSPKMDQLMLSNDRASFLAYMDNRKSGALQLLNTEVSKLAGITPACKGFLETEILFDHLYHRMMYGHVFKNKYQLEEAYFDFLPAVNLQNEFTGNYYYRQFLLAYMSHQVGKDNPLPFSSQYDQAQQQLVGKPLAFLQSEYIVYALKALKTDEILPKYESFSRTNPYILYEEKVISAYESAMQYAVGAVAPGFELADRNGREQSLSAFRGQVVYLNFWASWCKPCLKKMELMKTVQDELEPQGVVFLNVSLDRSEETWSSILDERELQGVHVLADKVKGKGIIKDYNVQVLPQYFILDKNGNFAPKPEKFDPIALRSQLLELSK